MKMIYFDCFSGISGDMTVAALLDLGVDPNYLLGELEKLHLDGYQIKISKVSKKGISACSFDVILEEHAHEHNQEHEHHHNHENACEHTHMHEHEHVHNHEDEHVHNHPHEHRNIHDIFCIIDNSEITKGAKELTKKIFTNLGEAEAKVHGTTLDQIHFHEVGAVDSIVDIVSTAICIDFLKPEKTIFSTICEGTGLISCQHGMMPVPVPATAQLLSSCKAPLKITDTSGEMVTPTGAAIVATLCDEFARDGFSFIPEKTGYGGGKKEFAHANVLRVMLGEISAKGKLYLLETNIDDTTPEILGYTAELLLKEGVRDVYFTSVQMKKFRPGVMLSTICDESLLTHCEELIFLNTTTIGIRRIEIDRKVLTREEKEIETKLGKAKVKICDISGRKRIYPEFESVKELSQKHDLPMLEVFDRLKSEFSHA